MFLKRVLDDPKHFGAHIFAVSISKLEKIKLACLFFSVIDWAAGLTINERICVFFIVDQYPWTRQSNQRIYTATSDGGVEKEAAA